MRIAAFGFRSVPPRNGSAGADKFAMELLPRLVRRGHSVLAYNRIYPGQEPLADEYLGVKCKYIKTVSASGFDTLLHSLKVTLDIIFNNTADVVHIQNGGNSVFALLLRLAGKKTFISQDGVDWKRDKWKWYARLYLQFSRWITAFGPTKVIFDNEFSKRSFESHFPWARRRFEFIPFGCDSLSRSDDTDVLDRLGLKSGQYFLFVGRFIPDKGLQYLIPAFEKTATDKKLVLVGGAPNPSEFDGQIRSTSDKRILFPGFMYGADTATLMRHAYAYIQPSDVEGLSPVILENMFLGVPLICSDIPENVYIVEDSAILFGRGDVESLQRALSRALSQPELLVRNAESAKASAERRFSWDHVVEAHVKEFSLGV